MKRYIFVLFLIIVGTVAYSQTTYSILIRTREQAIADAKRGLLPNGCGSADSFNQYFIPDGTWRAACDQHDIDYATLGMSKAEADRRLRANMIAQGAPAWVADFYVWGLNGSTGQAAYDDAQAKARRLNGLQNSSFPDGQRW